MRIANLLSNEGGRKHSFCLSDRIDQASHITAAARYFTFAFPAQTAVTSAAQSEQEWRTEPPLALTPASVNGAGGTGSGPHLFSIFLEGCQIEDRRQECGQDRIAQCEFQNHLHQYYD